MLKLNLPFLSYRDTKERRTMPARQPNILLVDDDAQIRRLLPLVLAESGYNVRSAADGFTALVEIRNVIPDVILSDLNMPGMSGFELLSEVRLRFPQIHVIAMSGAFSGGSVPAGVIADAFYEKGTNMDSLLKIVETMPHPAHPLPNRQLNMLATV
ncbi:MAG: response regulator [Edaphobacter sp.]